MRKIESNMNAAIKANQNWSSSNTTVTTENGISEVRLHGNLIAKVGDDFVTIFDGGWQSNTCLLYTSPSPRDATLSRMPSSA